MPCPVRPDGRTAGVVLCCVVLCCRYKREDRYTPTAGATTYLPTERSGVLLIASRPTSTRAADDAQRKRRRIGSQDDEAGRIVFRNAKSRQLSMGALPLLKPSSLKSRSSPRRFIYLGSRLFPPCPRLQTSTTPKLSCHVSTLLAIGSSPMYPHLNRRPQTCFSRCVPSSLPPSLCRPVQRKQHNCLFKLPTYLTFSRFESAHDPY